MQNNLDQYRDYKYYRASQYITLITQIGNIYVQSLFSVWGQWAVKVMILIGSDASYLYNLSKNWKECQRSSESPSGDS